MSTKPCALYCCVFSALLVCFFVWFFFALFFRFVFGVVSFWPGGGKESFISLFTSAFLLTVFV